MKNLFILSFIFFSFIANAQKKETKVAYSKNEVITITSLEITATKIKDLETINWQDVKDFFKSNTPEEKIELSFELDLVESKNKFKSSIKIGGQTKEIDSLIIKSKKIIKSIIKISKNY